MSGAGISVESLESLGIPSRVDRRHFSTEVNEKSSGGVAASTNAKLAMKDLPEHKNSRNHNTT